MFHLGLLFLTAVCAATAQDSCVILKACSGASYPPCQSLDDILLSLSSRQGPWKCVTVDLLDGDHSLTTPVFVNATDLSLYIVGSTSSRVSCSFNSSNATNLHSLHLYGLSTVVISSLNVYGCDRPIRLQNIGYLNINNSTFRSFVEGGALDVFNCVITEIVNCSFVGNRATSVIQDSQYRGNAGGVAIGFHGVSHTNQTKPSVLVAGTMFKGNMAYPRNQVTSSTLAQRRVFVGRGGGLAVYVEEEDTVVIKVIGCTFAKNSATAKGGGVYIFFESKLTGHTFLMADSLLEDNIVSETISRGSVKSEGVGGGILLAVASTPLDIRFPNRMVVTNCTFRHNQAPCGAGVYVLPALSPGGGYIVSCENSLFDGNYASEYAAAIGFVSLAFFKSFSYLYPYRITSCTFQNNIGVTGGIVAMPYGPLQMEGHNVFLNNTGAALRVIGATVTLNGTFDFIGNNADTSDGGAVYVTSQGQLILAEGTSMNFQGNHGRLGAAFVSEYSPEVSGFTRLLYNPLCFIRYENYQLSPFMWKGLNVTFSGNSALIGPVAYISQLDFCSWRGLTEPLFDSQNILKWSFLNADGSNRNLGHQPQDDYINYVQTPAVSFNAENSLYSASSGEMIPLQLSGLDEFNHATYAVFRIATSSSVNESGPVFHPSLLSDLPSMVTANCSYSLMQESYEAVNVSLSLFTDSYALNKHQGFKQNISVVIKHCPPGYVLEPSHSTSSNSGLLCMCNTLNDANIGNCEPGLNSVLLKPSLWAVAVGVALKTYRCPNGHCVQIHNTSAGSNTHGSVYQYDNPEAQCNCNRTGVLCGHCPQGYGVSALTNRCVTCGNGNGLLILGLYVVVVIATILIMLYPHPLMAGFYPCLFAIQLAPLISEEFPISFEIVRPYLYYISSSLAFYFPYDFCLLKSLNPVTSYCLRYTPPLLVGLTVVITLVIRKKVLRLCTIPWYGVWTVVLLLYTQAVHTSMNVLNCPHIQDSNGNTKPRWYVDGSVDCFSNGHLPLALFSILALVIEAGLIPLVALIAMEKLKRPWSLLHHLVEPLTNAFKEDWRWWGAMELARRFLLLLFTLPFPGNPIPPSYLLMVYICAYAFIQPYKSTMVNLLEVVLCVDLLVMLLIVGDSAIPEDLLYSHTTQLSAPLSNKDGCIMSGFTSYAGLLTPFYYLPLLAGIVCVAVGVASLFRAHKTSPHIDVTSHVHQSDWFEGFSSHPMTSSLYTVSGNEDNGLHSNYASLQCETHVDTK